MTPADLAAHYSADELLAALCAKLNPADTVAAVRAIAPFLSDEDKARRERRLAAERSKRSYQNRQKPHAEHRETPHGEIVATASDSHGGASENGKDSHGLSTAKIPPSPQVSPSPPSFPAPTPAPLPPTPKPAAKPPKPSPETVPIPDALKATPDFPERWGKFIESRRLIGEPMTYLAAEQMLNRFAARPDEAVDGVNLAIEKQWQGFSWKWFDRENSDLFPEAKPFGSNGHTPSKPKRCL